MAQSLFFTVLGVVIAVFVPIAFSQNKKLKMACAGFLSD